MLQSHGEPAEPWVYHWQSGTGCLYHPPILPVWHKASRAHWWRSRGYWRVRLLLFIFPYLSNSSSHARHGFQGWRRMTLLYASERRELAVMGSIWPGLHSTHRSNQNISIKIHLHIADQWRGMERLITKGETKKLCWLILFMMYLWLDSWDRKWWREWEVGTPAWQPKLFL